jgi:hypothetical protein
LCLLFNLGFLAALDVVLTDLIELLQLLIFFFLAATFFVEHHTLFGVTAKEGVEVSGRLWCAVDTQTVVLGLGLEGALKVIV